MPERDDLEPRKPEEVRDDVAAELRALQKKIDRLKGEARGHLPGVETK